MSQGNMPPVKNKYEDLRIDCLEDAEPVDAHSSWTITDSNTETITIFTAQIPDSSWIYGYNVYWANGRNSSKKPTAEHGKFRTQREAYLYAIGFMILYLSYFQPETKHSILSAESSLIQANLFD